jgi:succinate dehydrogenase / fumarate reductase cytochrome b subunit
VPPISRRPVFLNLLQIRLPPAGIMSIGHRASGVVLVLCIPLLASLFGESLRGPTGFADSAQLLSGGWTRLLLLVLTWALLHHLFAGIRHLLLDLDIGMDKPVARQSAWVVMIAAPVATLVLGRLLP